MTCMERQRHLNLLLVEDDEVDVMNVQRALRKNGIEHSLHIAHNGLEALEMLRKGDLGEPQGLAGHCLIWLDLNMPKMGGLEFLRILRSDLDLRRIPVVVLTTSAQEQDRVEAYNLNVAGYVVKPVTFSKFVDAVGKLNDYWMLSEMP